MLQKTMMRVPAWARWVLTLLWTAYFFVLLVQPQGQPIINTGLPPGPPSLQREILFTSLHILTFAFTTLLWIWAWLTQVEWRRALFISALMIMTLGVSTELWQATVPGRSTQIWDMSANLLGVAVGGWLAAQGRRLI